MGELERLVAADMQDHADDYASVVLARIGLEVPELLEGAELRALGEASTRALVREFAASLALDVETGFHAPSAPLAFTTRLARVGVPLASVLRSYRLGQETLIERAAQLARDRGDGPAALARLVRRSFRFADAAMSDVTAAYEHEREAAIRSVVARRTEVVAELLAGGEVDVARAERTLGYRLDGWHLAIICWPDQEHAGRAMLDALAEAARPLHAGRPLVLAEPGGEAAAWVPRRDPLTAVELDELGARFAARGLRATAGEPHQGVDGFAASHREAREARIAAMHVSRTVLGYRDVSLVALLLRDADAARAFAAAELGRLSAPTRTAAQLRATVEAFFASGHDRSGTARTLGVHRNTVARRLEAAERAVGHPFDERVRELETALALWAILVSPRPQPSASPR